MVIESSSEGFPIRNRLEPAGSGDYNSILHLVQMIADTCQFLYRYGNIHDEDKNIEEVAIFIVAVKDRTIESPYRGERAALCSQ